MCSWCAEFQAAADQQRRAKAHVDYLDMIFGGFPDPRTPDTSMDRPRMSDMKRFHLERTTDVSGVSGTGTVAEGVQFSDGKIAVRWLGETPSTVMWENAEQMMSVHGHGGATSLEWDD